MADHLDLTNKALEEADAEAKKESTEKVETPTGDPKEEKKETTDKTVTPEAKKEEEMTEDEKVEAKKKEEEIRLEAEKKEIEVKAKVEGKEEGKEIEKTKTEEKKKEAWWKPEEKKKEETPATEINKDTQAKVTEYDRIIKDPEIKAFIEAKKSGKTLRSFVNELKGVDPETLSPEDLYKIQLKSLNLSTDEYDDEIDKFNELSKVIQLNTTKSIKEELLAKQEEALGKFSTEASAEAKATEERTKFITEKANTDLDNYIKEIEGKELLGVKITPEIAEGLKLHADKNFTIYNPDGTFNIPQLVKLSLFDKYPDKLMEENISRATEAGKEEILDVTTRPSTGTTAKTQRMPDLVKAAEADVKAAEEQAKMNNPNFRKIAESNNLPVPTN